jgi:hypothetical protein
MVSGTVLAIFFVPLFFVVVARWFAHPDPSASALDVAPSGPAGPALDVR